jgi:hypothetical protein
MNTVAKLYLIVFTYMQANGIRIALSLLNAFLLALLIISVASVVWGLSAGLISKIYLK